MGSSCYRPSYYYYCYVLQQGWQQQHARLHTGVLSLTLSGWKRPTRCIYRKVANSRLSWLVAHPRIFRLFMKGKINAYVLWPIAKRVQNWIVDQSTARHFTVTINIHCTIFNTNFDIWRPAKMSWCTQKEHEFLNSTSKQLWPHNVTQVGAMQAGVCTVQKEDEGWLWRLITQLQEMQRYQIMNCLCWCKILFFFLVLVVVTVSQSTMSEFAWVCRKNRVAFSTNNVLANKLKGGAVCWLDD